MKPPLQASDPLEVLARIRCEREPIPDGGERLRFRIFSWGTYFALLTLTIIFGATLGSVVLFVEEWILVLLLGFILVVFLVIFVSSLLEMICWDSTVEIRPEAIHIKAGFWGAQKRETFERKKSIRLDCSQDQRKGKSTWWSVRILQSNGQPLPIVTRLSSRLEAEALRAWLLERVRLEPIATSAPSGSL